MLRARASRPAAALATVALILTGCSTTEPVLATPDTSRTVLNGASFSAAPGSVAVLAIDDFGGDGTTPPTDKTINCAYPTGTYGSKGGGGGLPPGMLHGEAVFNELYGLFTKGLNSSSTPYAFGDLPANVVKKPVEIWSHPNTKTQAPPNIMLVSVDSANFDTRKIADRIESVITTLEKRHGVERFVLNMSFVIAPCDVEDWLKQIGYTSDSNVAV